MQPFGWSDLKHWKVNQVHEINACIVLDRSLAIRLASRRKRKATQYRLHDR